MTSEKPESLFDANYFATGCGHSYERDEERLRFWGKVAERIIQDINPGSVLDAGCAMGFLVEGLRERGVAAFGVDISEYAIQNVHPDIQPYCRVGSVTEPFPQKYDLITCFEVLEHLSPREAEEAVANFCRYTDDILFSSTPFDYEEATHFNVQPPEYWAGLFARHGFVRDVEYDASFIIPWAVRFRRCEEPLYRVVSTYERRLWLLQEESKGTRRKNLEYRREIASLQNEVRRLENRWARLEGSASWQVMLWLQSLRARLAPPGSTREKLLTKVLPHQQPE